LDTADRRGNDPRAHDRAAQAFWSLAQIDAARAIAQLDTYPPCLARAADARRTP